MILTIPLTFLCGGIGKTVSPFLRFKRRVAARVSIVGNWSDALLPAALLPCFLTIENDNNMFRSSAIYAKSF